ncbi:MAG TPA: glycosyltransferase [Thermomicrobiales bacterium]|nr:glycosyltransferase [Thermomicrobiales bacterium]
MPEAALEASATYIQISEPGSWSVNGRTPRARPGRPAEAEEPLRIAVYSHDTLGLGHMRRNLLIAETLAAARPSTILLISGAVESRSFAVPPGVDYLSLPALYKDSAGQYRPRRLGGSLEELIALRSETIRGALRAFRPDVFIVDNVPAGAQGELVPALTELRREGGTRFVLGLRDILDEPEAIRAEWSRAGAHRLLREIYDAIWIYGDRAVYDALAEYDFLAPYAARVRFTGYLDRRADERPPDATSAALLEQLERSGRRLALGTVGGGQDGATLALNFAAAQFPDDMEGVLLTGPYMPESTARALRQMAAARDDLRIVDFLPEPAPLLRRADRVIAMGGYNTTCELLAYGKPALIVPRVRPRREQWLRASRLRDLGALDALHPDELTPDALGAWLASDRVPTGKHAIDMNGLSRLPQLLAELYPAPLLSARL